MLALVILATSISGGGPQAQYRELAELPFLRSTKRAFVVSRPELAFGPTVESYSISPNGRYILAIQHDPVDELAVLKAGRTVRRRLVLWDASRKTRRTVANFPTTVTQYGTPSIAWLGRSSTAMIDFYASRAAGTESSFHAWFFTPATGALRRVRRTNTGGLEWIAEASPVEPIALLINRHRVFDPSQVQPAIKFEVVSAAGEVTGRVARGAVASSQDEIYWSSEGGRVSIYASRRSATGSIRSVILEVSLVPLTVVESEEIVWPYYEESELHSDIWLDLTGVSVEPSSETVVSEVDWTYSDEGDAVWLVSDKTGDDSKLLVAIGADQAAISPNARFVAYRQSDALFYRNMRRVSRTELDAILAARWLQAQMTRAKSIATAIYIFAADHDDRLPYAHEFPDLLIGYFGNPDVFKGFTYLGNGEILSKIRDFAGTVVGYLLIDGGRVVAYADSHVEWHPDP